MSNSSVLTYLLISLLAIQNLKAQTGDWNVVKATPEGAHLSVVSDNLRKRCALVRVTDEGLICDEEPVRFRGYREFVFHRPEVTEIRREYAREKKMALGAWLGAGVGAAIGTSLQSNDAETRVYGAAGCVLAGIIGGTLGGRIFSGIHTRVIYRR